MDLYRQEAIEGQRRRLFGEVAVHQPVSLQVLSGAAIAIVLLIFGWLAVAKYAKKEVVLGWITPSAGVAQVYASRTGVAKQVYVAVDTVVQEGQPLVALSADESGTGGSLVSQERAQIEARLAELNLQLAEAASRYRSDGQRTKGQAEAVLSEAGALLAEERFAKDQLEIRERELNNMQPLIDKGFVSRIAVDQARQQVIIQEQAVADLDRQARSKRADAADARFQETTLSAEAASQASQLRAARLALQQSLAELDVQGALVVRAPTAGRVTAVNIKAGDTAAATAPLVAIAPSRGALEVELLVPTRSAGFLAGGQDVRMTVDAFPSQRFGALNGKISTISRSPINPGQLALPFQLTEPAYRVTAKLDSGSIRAYGQARALRAGMTLKAFVTTANRTFLQWMIDPLLAEH